MPKLTHTFPSYGKHRPSGQAVITLNGRDFYLGPHGTKASRLEYDANGLQQGRQIRPDNSDGGARLAVVQLIVAYLNFARDYYRKDGAPTSESKAIVYALRYVKLLWNSVSQTEFGRQRVGSYVAPFGEGMDLVSTTAVLGAFNDGPSGAVYLYNVANASNPVQIQRVGGPAGSQTFGRSIDFDGRFAVISDSTQHAYLYMVVPEPRCVAVAVMGGLALLVVRRNGCNSRERVL